MGTIVWIFFGIGVLYVVCILIVYILGITELKYTPFTGAWDLVSSTSEYSTVAMIIPLIPMLFVSWIIEKIMRWCGCNLEVIDTISTLNLHS